MTALNLTETKTEIVTDQFIGGNWVQGENNDSVDIIDPFNNGSVCAVHPATIAQVNNAIETAHTTYNDPSWRDLLDRERGTLLYRLAELLRRDIEIFAALESVDTGIPIRETRMEVSTSALHMEYFAGFAGKIEGSYQDLGARFNYTRRELSPRIVKSRS